MHATFIETECGAAVQHIKGTTLGYPTNYKHLASDDTMCEEMGTR